jgi:hypothetical protein
MSANFGRRLLTAALSVQINAGFPRHSARAAGARDFFKTLLECFAQYFTIAANDFASSDAPPTSAPSISSCSISVEAFSGFTDPP